MAIVPHEVPVAKPIKQATTNVIIGINAGDKEPCSKSCETNSAVGISLVTNAVDHAIVRIKAALNMVLNPSTTSSMSLPKAIVPRHSVMTIATSSDNTDDQVKARYESASPMVVDNLAKKLTFQHQTVES